MKLRKPTPYGLTMKWKFTDEEEVNTHLMEIYEEDEVTLYFTYDDLFRICKKLNK